jgi:tetratricopeptide (TPR) repeat protein
MPKIFVDRYLLILTPINEQLGISDAGGSMQLADDVFREMEFLSQAGSAVRCLRLVVSALRSCGPSTPSRTVADLVEYGERCVEQILHESARLPALRKEAARASKSGEMQAALGFALNHLGDEEGANISFRNALKYANTDALCFVCHRDCLNNLGWNSYLAGKYEEAMVWFDQACWMRPDTGDVIHGILVDELQPPYKLAFENILLCLARLNRTPEIKGRLSDYCSRFGRLPRYEAGVLLRCGIDAEREYVESRIELTSSTVSRS